MCRAERVLGGGLSLSIITIQLNRTRLSIRPDLGAGIGELLLRDPNGRWHPVLRSAATYAGQSDELACELLAPWRGRIGHAIAPFAKRDDSSRSSSDDAISRAGEPGRITYSILDRSPVSARLELNLERSQDRDWPWAHRVVVRYELDANTLVCRFSVTNLDLQAMPAALGFQPFWMRRLWDERDDVRVQANLEAPHPTQDMSPAGPSLPDSPCQAFRDGGSVGASPLHGVFVGSLNDASIHWPASDVRARFECSPELSHTSIDVPTNRRGGAMPWFCLGPLSLPSDTFDLATCDVSRTGVRVLQPGESLRVTWVVTFDFGSDPESTGAKLSS